MHVITNKRMICGDGSAVGGIAHANFMDVQNRNMVAATAGGSANALTLSISPAPNVYALFQKFVFKAVSNNTGNTTLQANALAAVSLKTIVSGVVSELPSGTVIAGRVYEAVYDGTQFILNGVGGVGGLVDVGQGDLRTSVGSVSVSCPQNLLAAGPTLPGGQYGFGLECKANANDTSALIGYGCSSSTSYVHRMLVHSFSSPSPNRTYYAQERYIISSPPFDMGGVRQTGFIFLLKNLDGTIAGSYIAEVPPWAYNGPTNITACKIDPETGKKFRCVEKPRSLRQVLDGVPPEYIYEEITMDIKNADMGMIPHPFGELKAGQRVIMLDAAENTQIANLIEAQNHGDNRLAAAISSGAVYADNEAVAGRFAPDGVMVSKLKFKSKSSKIKGM